MEDHIAIEAYRRGQCHVYALALCRRFGWTPGILRDEEDSPIHVVAVHPDGAGGAIVVDVMGVQTVDECRESLGRDGLWFDYSTEAAVLAMSDGEGDLREVNDDLLAEADTFIARSLESDPHSFDAPARREDGLGLPAFMRIP
jgi:hypothetical protein